MDARDRPLPAPDDEAERRREARAEMARANPDVATICLVILTVLAVLAVLHAAADIVLPLLFAIVLNLLLGPPKRLLTNRLRLPPALAALVLIAGLFMLIAGVGTAISVPASQWLSRAPETLPKLQERLVVLSRPIGELRKALEQAQHLTEQPPPEGTQRVVVQSPPNVGGMGVSVLQGTRAALGQALTLGVVLFFLLVAGDTLLRRLVEILPGLADKKRVVGIAEEIEENISAYLLTITAMNLLVGIANGLQMWAQGMPDPLLWGTVAFLLNYIPILGPALGMMLFFLVALFATDGIWWALLPPFIYLLIHMAEGEAITPMLVAKRFTLNPVLLIVALFFWDWMWGVAGALLAVPLLAILKIVCDHVPALTPLGHLVGAPRGRGVNGS
ncbi:AI-2E family transporter [Rhodovastum atsumiense]|uniref:AI-2E family transporter n=1 Tax=Rhodovastum atsumiense TaxID=504468 RepID=A0A5M6IR15_9PROT|nr:AI-2E family transporter [Rhodovastum atsumiense]KAA5610349.1 AI-2E family transporter [Rhodovastum atsumiense]CAH2600909.1 AI-2E family transporter [Rhodovastum atsumiense]